MIGENGRVYDTLAVKDAINVDWEDLAKDPEGNLYIGDFGNKNVFLIARRSSGQMINCICFQKVGTAPTAPPNSTKYPPKLAITPLR